MGYVVTNPANYLISAQQTGSGNGSAIDARAALPAGYLQWATYQASAAYTIQASFDSTAWLSITSITATTTTASAQWSGYYPYIRAQLNSLWSGGGNTGSGYLFFHPLV